MDDDETQVTPPPVTPPTAHARVKELQDESAAPGKDKEGLADSLSIIPKNEPSEQALSDGIPSCSIIIGF